MTTLSESDSIGADPDASIPPLDDGLRDRVPVPGPKEADVDGEAGFEGTIGIASCDITPPTSARRSHWAEAPNETFSGVHRPLKAYAVTFQHQRSDSPLVLVTLDLGSWPTPQAEWEVRKPILDALSLPESHLMLQLTGTHSGPSLNSRDFLEAGGIAAVKFVSGLSATITELVRQALRDAEWSLLEWELGWCGLAHQRYRAVETHLDGQILEVETGREVDGSLYVGRVTDLHRQTRAVFVNYACHPTVLGPDNTLMSPDFVGTARSFVEASAGVPCVYLQGFCGDLGPLNSFVSDPDLADKAGRQIAYATLSALEGMLPPGTLLGPTRFIPGSPAISLLEPMPAAMHRRLKAISIDFLHSKPTRLNPFTLDGEQLGADESGLWERVKKGVAAKVVSQCITKITVWRVGDAVLLGFPVCPYVGISNILQHAGVKHLLVGLGSVNGTSVPLSPHGGPGEVRAIPNLDDHEYALAGLAARIAARISAELG